MKKNYGRLLLFLALILSIFPFSSLLPVDSEPWETKLTDLPYPAKESTAFLSCAMRYIIRFHQEVISPIDGPRSHFKPSSSEYMAEAIRKYGFIKGYIMGSDRLLRENSDPWVYRTAIIDELIWKVDFP